MYFKVGLTGGECTKLLMKRTQVLIVLLSCDLICIDNRFPAAILNVACNISLLKIVIAFDFVV